MRLVKTIIVVFTIMFCHCVYAGGITISKAYLNNRPCKLSRSFHTKELILMEFYLDHYSFSGGGDKFEYIVFLLEGGNRKKKYFLKEMRRYGKGSEYLPDHSGSLRNSVYFTAPIIPGNYRLKYFKEPFFSSIPLGFEVGNMELSQTDVELLEDKYDDRQSQSFCSVYIASYDENINREEKEPSIFLKLNDRVPYGIDSFSIKKGLRFSWTTANMPSDSNTLFKFRIYPNEEWSEWQTEKKAEYFFVPRGNHEFQLFSRYVKNSDTLETDMVRFSFTLEKPILVSPSELDEYKAGDDITFIDKGGIKRKTKDPASIVSKVYDRSYALLIGVDRYRDREFVSLPYLKNDISSARETFSNLGFSIVSPNGNTRERIISSVRSTLLLLKENDRLIIYISSHGFLDPATNQAFIATSNCSKTDPSNAISIKELKDLVEAWNTKTRHILLILDCCVSGMGVINKSGSLNAVKTLATQRGSHILTAGLADQSAKMVEQLKMSVFTYYLNKGLRSKEADYTKDGIVTLSELLVYVQYNVANYTNSEQVPTYGRISGFGEIIFF